MYRVTMLRDTVLHRALTERRRQIIDAMLDGLSNAEIGERLGIATRTVKGQMSHLYLVFGCAGRIELAQKLITVYRWHDP